ncbi:hypothetical protein QUF90_04620 [Desulfococcaceae bacterium HSG9]|nr:hypothetical protein [Desulfococcaceae bacterium HSG9]
MITLNQFYKALERIAYFPDARQQDAIETPINKPLFLSDASHPPKKFWIDNP